MEDLVMMISQHRLQCLAAVGLLLVPMHQDVANTIGNTLLVDVESGTLITMIITSLEAGLLRTESVTSEIILPEVLGGMEWRTASIILETTHLWMIDTFLGHLVTEEAVRRQLGILLTAAFGLAVQAH